MNFGKFIVFEGINGSGKTTIINKIIQNYTNNNIKFKYLKFPDRNSKSGKIIDKFLKNNYNFKNLYEQIQIFAENRKESQEIIFNYLSQGYIILCDRYLYSNLAYTLTDQTFNILNNNQYEYINLDQIIQYDKNIIKPNLVFLIKGNYIQLRNEQIQERYHNNEIKNTVIFNNYLLALNHTKTNYNIINNNFNELDNTTNNIINIINTFKNINKCTYF
jgi:dTMP kinase